MMIRLPWTRPLLLGLVSAAALVGLAPATAETPATAKAPASADTPVCRAKPAPTARVAGEVRPVTPTSGVTAAETESPSVAEPAPEAVLRGDRHGNVKGWLRSLAGEQSPVLPAGARAIDAGGGELFVEIPMGALEGLEAAGLEFREVPDADRLNIGPESFDVRDGGPSIAPEWATTPGGAPRRPYLVKFDAPVRDAWLADLEADGAEVVQYEPSFGYLLLVPAGFEERVHGRPHVAYGGEYHPAYKARPELKAKAANDQGIALRVVLFDLPGGQERIDALVKSGVRIEAQSEGTGTSQWTRVKDVVLTGVRTRDLRAILREPSVYWVEEWAQARAEDERASQIIAGNYTLGVPVTGYHAWLAALGADGTGVTVAVADSGFDTGLAGTIHEDLRNRTGFAAAICPNSRDQDGHGTNTASITVGDPRLPTGTGLQDASGFYWGTGGAPGANLWVQKALNDGDCTTSYAGEPNVLAANAYSVGGARIGNHSFTDGATPGNGYTANCALWDARTRDADIGVAGNQPYLVVFSAGNSGPGAGSLTSPHAAKNILSVANSENYRPGQCPGVAGCGGPADDIDTLNDSSSRGPTVDNRLKPDIAAPGHAIAGARSSVATYDCFCDSASGAGCCASTGLDGANKYTAYTGTSQAAPRAAGAAAIVFDWYRDRTGVFPSPAMAKAIMIDGAVDMKVPDIPNFNEGWGRINLSRSLQGPAVVPTVDQSVVLGTTGDATAYTVNGIVQDPTRPVGATLVWTDPPGAVGCNPCLVNDLDLLATQGATTWRGNSFTAGFSNTAATADNRNNVERLNLPPGGASCAPIQFKVRAQTLGGDGVPGNADATDQDFALVTSNVGATGVPFLNVASSAVSGGCDGDAYLDRRETATLTVNLTNAGCAQADGVTATVSVLSAPAGATVNVSPSGALPIGTLAAGAGAPGVWQVTLQDNPASLCAGKVVLQVAITDSAARTWTRTVPVTLDVNSLSPAVNTDPATVDNSSAKSAEWSLRTCRTTSPTTSWHMGQTDCTGIVRDASSQDLVFSYNLPAGALLKTFGFQHAFGGYRNTDFTLTDSVQVDIDPENDGSFVNLATWKQGIDNPTVMTAAGPFDLSPFNVTHGPTLKVRFRFQSAANWVGGANTAAGWDVDDIVLSYDTVNCDAGSCPICTGPPAAVGDSVNVTRNGGDLTVSWSPVPGATRYNVYMGSAGTWTSHAIFSAAGLDGANSCFEPTTSATFADPGGDVYFLVAADSGCAESALGISSGGAPRPYASPSCSAH